MLILLPEYLLPFFKILRKLKIPLYAWELFLMKRILLTNIAFIKGNSVENAAPYHCCCNIGYCYRARA